MIYATVFEGEKTFGLTLQGHAGGIHPSVICAAASMLGYTAAQTVVLAARDGLLKKKPHIRMESGDVAVTASPKPERREEVRHIFYVVECGLRLLAKQYPREVTVRFMKG